MSAAHLAGAADLAGGAGGADLAGEAGREVAAS